MYNVVSFILALICALIMGTLVTFGINIYIGVATGFYIFWKLSAFFESRV